jgi:hypothetical protein
MRGAALNIETVQQCAMVGSWSVPGPYLDLLISHGLHHRLHASYLGRNLDWQDCRLAVLPTNTSANSDHALFGSQC